MNLLRTPALAVAVVLFAGSAPAEPPAPRPVDVDGLKRAAEREARSASPEGCRELLQETTEACVDATTRGLKVNCKRYVMALEMSASQKDGALFDTGSAATNQRSGDAACRVHLKSLRRAREKGSAALRDPGSTPPRCAEVGELLRRECFPRLGSDGKMPAACSSILTVISQRPVATGTREPDEAARCESAFMAWKMSQPRP